ncbi:MAG: Rieske 2Fe-2S domain-containing protein [Caldilineaceae bacterium]
MATISELSGDDREQRIAELKRKMQENAKRAQAAHEAEEAASDGQAVAVESAPAAVAIAEQPSGEAVAVAEPTPEVADTNGTVVESAPVATATTAAVATPVAPVAAAPSAAVVQEEEDDGSAEFTRREFLTYAWGAALGLLTVEAGLVSYFFMYPRFRAGEFGGKFFLAATDVPALDAPPVPMTAGKFWFVNTDNGPKAIYMVCTHLGCLYKWQASNNRFECPCHGSKFTKDGFYIEGPAPRSLDSFELEEENGQVVVDTGAKITGNPSSESPARAAAA